MSRFQVHTHETAPEASRPQLDAAAAKYGRVPNLIGALAESPAAVEAYAALGELVGRSSFTPTERHVAWFAINAENDCRYCMAAHTAIAGAEKIDPEVVQTAREVAEYEDERLEALRRFALQVVRQRGWVDDAEVDAFLAAGYTRAQVLELVTIVAHKTISNYTNHLVDTPLDDAFARHAWRGPQVAAAG